MSTNGRTQIVILGGGFGGVYTALHLEKQLAHAPNVDITLVNRDNFWLCRKVAFEAICAMVSPGDLRCAERENNDGD